MVVGGIRIRIYGGGQDSLIGSRGEDQMGVVLMHGVFLIVYYGGGLIVLLTILTVARGTLVNYEALGTLEG